MGDAFRIRYSLGGTAHTRNGVKACSQALHVCDLALDGIYFALVLRDFTRRFKLAWVMLLIIIAARNRLEYTCLRGNVQKGRKIQNEGDRTAKEDKYNGVMSAFPRLGLRRLHFGDFLAGNISIRPTAFGNRPWTCHCVCTGPIPSSVMKSGT